MSDQNPTPAFDVYKYTFGLYISVKQGELFNYRKFFEDYISKAEENIQLGQKVLQEKYDDWKTKDPDNYYEYIDALDDDSEQHFVFNPALLHHSMFLYIFSYYETSVVQLCKELEMFSLPKKPIPDKTNTLGKYLSYIFDTLPAKDLQPARSKLAPYQTVRNKLIHKFGFLDHTETKILAGLQKLPGIHVNQNNMSFYIKDVAFINTFMERTFSFLEALVKKAEELKQTRAGAA